MRRWQRRLLRVAAAVFLIVVTIVGVRVHDALGLPDLKPWHRFVPASEVRARDVDEKFTLDDYLKREERVFREVREGVEARVPRGEPRRFNRYVRGSFSSAERFGTDWNRTFERVPGRIRGGALLLHGLTDSPYSMRWLAERLEREGFYVLAPRMPGHGTVPAALLETDWQDWMAVAKMGARHVKGRIGEGKPFLIVGYSCGGGLAVKYSLDALDDATLPKADRLVLLSPLIGVDRLAGFTRMAALPGLLPPFEKARWLEVAPEYNPFKYNSFPAHAAQQTHDLTTALKAQVEDAAQAKRIGKLPPILTFQSAVDDTVSTEDLVTALYGKLAGNGSELVLFDVNRLADWQPFFAGGERGSWMTARRRSYRLTVVTNARPGTDEVVAISTAAGAGRATLRPLGLAWPAQVFSPSHVALPFPACDPLYGPGTPDHPARELRFATLSPRGERKVLALPLGNLMRITWNPFYPYLESRMREWIGGSGEEIPKDPCG
jgi:alpha-beta hydrolase superfamily lysophospholipase